MRRVKSRRQKISFFSDELHAKENLRDRLRADFQRFYSPQPLPKVEPIRLSEDQQSKLLAEFSNWVDEFLTGKGFEALWDLQFRHGVDPSTAVMLLTWWKIRDMQLERLPQGKLMVRKLKTSKDRQRLAKKFIKRALKLERFDDELKKAGSLLTELRLTLGFAEIPSNQVFPFDPSPETTSLRRYIRLQANHLRHVAEWISQLPRPRKGTYRDFENFHRVVHLCGYLKGFSGKPLYEIALRILHAAFRDRFPAFEKSTAIKHVQNALRQRGDEKLPETVVPDALKRAAQKRWRQYVSRTRGI